MWARIVCGVSASSRGLKDPAVLSQHRGIRQGDATGMSPSGPGVAVRRASGKMMHEGAVNVMTEGAGGGTLPMTRGTACGRVVMAPAGKTPKTKGRRRQVKAAHGVLPGREEVVRGDVNEDAMQVRHHGRESVTKGTVMTGIDFTGEPPVERRGRRARRDTHVGRERDGVGVESRRAPVGPGAQRRRGEPEHTGSDRRAR